MKNSRITVKERNLIKGALRRVFARSELRNSVIKETIMLGYNDISRPRVKTWCYCPVCEKPQAKSSMVVDHIQPVVGIEEKFEDMTLDFFIDKLWCDKLNLMGVCVECHKLKSAREQKERAAFRRKNK